MSLLKNASQAFVLLATAALGGVACSSAPKATAPEHTQVSAIVLKNCQLLSFLKEFERELFNQGFTRKPLNSAEEGIPIVRFPEPFELQERYLHGSPELIYFEKNDYKSESGKALIEVRNTYGLSTCVQKEGSVYLVAFRDDLTKEDRFFGTRFTDALAQAAMRSSCVFEALNSRKEVGFWTSSAREYYFQLAKKGACEGYIK